MSGCWKRMFRKPAMTGERPDVEAAKRDLSQARAETQRVKDETPYFEALGRELREIRERNHLAEAFYAAAQKGGRRG